MTSVCASELIGDLPQGVILHRWVCNVSILVGCPRKQLSLVGHGLPQWVCPDPALCIWQRKEKCKISVTDMTRRLWQCLGSLGLYIPVDKWSVAETVCL